MYWIIALSLVVLALTVPKLRRASVIVLIVLLILLGWAIQRSSWWSPTADATLQREAARAPAPLPKGPPLTAVSAAQLRLSGSGAPWTFVGRLSNMSERYRITAVTFRIERRDCYLDAPDPSGCVALWQGSETIFTSIPPGEWREFSSAIWLHGSLPRTRGEIRDAIEITAVQGAESNTATTNERRSRLSYPEVP